MLLFQQATQPATLDGLKNILALSVDLLLRLGIDALAVGVLIRVIYYRIYHKSALFLTFFAFNLTIFLVTYMLHQVQMSMGAAFGLFAVFSMLRYRTEGISIKDMTYLFVVISIGLISAISETGPLPAGWGWIGTLLLNALIVFAVYVLESEWFVKRELTKTIYYDRTDLLRPEHATDLLDDLRARTGLPVYRVEVHDIDFRKESAQLTVFYHRSSTVPVTPLPAPKEIITFR
ncbi:MAG: DUF4956 domain-containing protein [Cytophagales bacterium]|nr:MAG: DUF4956 domain-containing protein [Cytophagales bacterium]